VNRLTYRTLVNTDVAMRVGIARAKMTACPQRRKLCTRTERSLKHGVVVLDIPKKHATKKSGMGRPETTLRRSDQGWRTSPKPEANKQIERGLL